MICHVVMSASHDCLPESEVRKTNWLPESDSNLDPSVNNERVKFKKINGRASRLANA
jgi:hypothetical protein